MTSGIKESYESLSKRFSLPKFEELEEFQVSSIEKPDFLLSSIRESLMEKIHDIIDFLSDMFQPDASITNMYESRGFSEDEKKAAFDAFGRLMFWKRAALEASVMGEDRANAEFISGFVGEWKGLKSRVIEAVKKAKSSWETDSEQSEKLGYFG